MNTHPQTLAPMQSMCTFTKQLGGHIAGLIPTDFTTCTLLRILVVVALEAPCHNTKPSPRRADLFLPVMKQPEGVAISEVLELNKTKWAKYGERRERGRGCCKKDSYFKSVTGAVH